MKTNRRKFIKTVGAGAAGVGVATSTFASSSQNSIKSDSSRIRMVVRADDIGFSDVCNIGSFETIENGIVTSADVMLDSPGTVDALERLRKLPWISVGWHTHMWGTPVLNSTEVSSLIEKDGQFKGRFRLDLSQAQDVDFNEAIKELRAQLERCIRILGRVPDTGVGGSDNSPWGRAMKQVNEEYKLVSNFFSSNNELNERPILEAKKRGEKWAQGYTSTGTGIFPASGGNEKWADKKIYFVGMYACNAPLNTDSITELEESYDPVLIYTEDRAGILNYPKDSVVATIFHPGYVDYWVYRLGERGNRAQARKYVLSRVQEVSALCDLRVKNWIKDNNIELINFRDALYGTSEYQSYLKLKGDNLAMI